MGMAGGSDKTAAAVGSKPPLLLGLRQLLVEHHDAQAAIAGRTGIARQERVGIGLANHIGDLQVLQQAIALARDADAKPCLP